MDKPAKPTPDSTKADTAKDAAAAAATNLDGDLNGGAGGKLAKDATPVALTRAIEGLGEVGESVFVRAARASAMVDLGLAEPSTGEAVAVTAEARRKATLAGESPSTAAVVMLTGVEGIGPEGLVALTSPAKSAQLLNAGLAREATPEDIDLAGHLLGSIA